MRTTGHPLLPPELQEEYRELGHWEGTTLADIVKDWALRDPSRTAITGPVELSYQELWEKAQRIAGSLQARGLQPREFLLAVLPTSWQGVVLEVAASIIAVAIAPRSAHASPAVALNTFDQLGARGLVLDAALLADPDWRSALET